MHPAQEISSSRALASKQQQNIISRNFAFRLYQLWRRLKKYADAPKRELIMCCVNSLHRRQCRAWPKSYLTASRALNTHRHHQRAHALPDVHCRRSPGENRGRLALARLCREMADSILRCLLSNTFHHAVSRLDARRPHLERRIGKMSLLCRRYVGVIRKYAGMGEYRPYNLLTICRNAIFLSSSFYRPPQKFAASIMRIGAPGAAALLWAHLIIRHWLSAASARQCVRRR